MSVLRANTVEQLDGRGKSSITFSSVQSLKDSTAVGVGDVVSTDGYTTPGDGGGNLYEIVAAATGTDDGGSFIDLAGSGLQAKGLFGDSVNVKQFGAVGDGGTDDIAAIQAALEFTPVTGFFSGTKVLFPGGYYRISSPIIIPHENIYLVGEGADVTVIRALESFPVNSYLIRTIETASDDNPLRRWGVSRMMLDGRNQADGIGAIDAALIDLDRLIIRAVRDGIVITASVPPTAVEVFQPGGPYITNCRFNASRHQIFLDYCTQVWVTECWFVGSGSEHIVISRSDKVKILNSEFNNWGGEAAVLFTSDNATFPSAKNSVVSNLFFNGGSGNAVKEIGESRYNNIQGNAAWAGEKFEVIGVGSISGNNLGTTVSLRSVVAQSIASQQGYRKFSDGWAEAWLAADVNTETTASQDFALPVTFLTGATSRAIVSISAQVADTGPMSAVTQCSGACTGPNVRVKFNSGLTGGTIGIRILVSGFTAP